MRRQSAAIARRRVSGRSHGREWTAIAGGQLDELVSAASAAGAEVVERAGALSLDEIFLARAGRQSVCAEET